MDFSFFITYNKSGHKTRETWFKKNHPEEYQKILTHTTKLDLKSFKEKIWFYYHNLTEIPTCPCGGASKLFKQFIKTNNPKEIISYSDNRYFDGSLYGRLVNRCIV